MAWKSSYKKYPWWKEEILKEVMTPKNHILVKLKKDAVYALSQLDKSLELHFKQPFRKLSNGETGEIEKKHLIHEFGDWIINVDHQQTERLTFDQVKELLQSKIFTKSG